MPVPNVVQFPTARDQLELLLLPQFRLHLYSVSLFSFFRDIFMAPNTSRQQMNRNQSRGRVDSPQTARQGHRPRGSIHTANLSFQNKQEFRTSTPQNPPPPKADLGMSPASRYSQNLRVLCRHDPSIMSIFDQFSHVCLYQHDGEKWEKKGYEGSMFLFER